MTEQRLQQLAAAPKMLEHNRVLEVEPNMYEVALLAQFALDNNYFDEAARAANEDAILLSHNLV